MSMIYVEYYCTSDEEENVKELPRHAMRLGQYLPPREPSVRLVAGSTEREQQQQQQQQQALASRSRP
jgi:hypothetical protein